MMDVLLLADLHGNYGKVDAFLGYDYDAVIIAGDITNMGPVSAVEGLFSRIDVPVFTDRGRHIKLPWFVRIPKSARSGQDRDGEIDASQVKSVSVNRFDKKIGDVTPGQIVGVVDAIALCLGYELPGGPGYS